MTHSPLSDEMRAYYAARAPYYDAVYAKPERAADISYLQKSLPARLCGRNVLEVACGTGYWTQHIAATADSMTATDATAEPLNFAKLRPNVDRVEFRLEDAYQLSADISGFDAAFAGLWFSHIPVERRTHFVTQLHNALEPGAIVVFIDNSEVQCREFPIAETDRFGNTYQHRQLADGTIHRVLKNFPVEDELRRVIGEGGVVHEYQKLENFWLLQYEVTSTLIDDSHRRQRSRISS